MPIFSPSGNCFWTSRTLFHGIFLAWSVRRTLDMNTRMLLMPSTLGNKLKGRQVHFFGLGDRSASRWGSALHWIGLYPWRWHYLMRSWGEYLRVSTIVWKAPHVLVQIYSAMRYNQVWCEGAEKTNLGRNGFLKVNHNFLAKVSFLICPFSVF